MYHKRICLFIILFIFTGVTLSEECHYSADADTPTKRYKNNADGTILDTQSGLTWLRCPLGMKWDTKRCRNIPERMNWSDAQSNISKLNEQGGYAGFQDWRLPTLDELSTLVERQCYAPAINSEIFPDTPLIGFWSSTTDPDYQQGAWLVYFLHGSRYMGNQGYEWAIRAVRK
ncbi:MAG: DUF1566 domain-containing protein [Gammaproteobacteria bacterium]|nr:DUF1566 domain-containing protein [Gammaproteobacteria bacterium]